MTERCEPAEHMRDADGWYWVQCKMSEPFPSWWFVGGQDWLCNGRHNFASSLMHADGWRCLGPCATPAEVDALRAERDAMEQQMLHEHQSAVDQCGIAEALRDRVEELEGALLAAVECGMVPTSSALDGGANRHSRHVAVADQIRAALKGAKP